MIFPVKVLKKKKVEVHFENLMLKALHRCIFSNLKYVVNSLNCLKCCLLK